MPIQLDWNFENEDLPDEAGPRWQPDFDAGRRRGWLIGLLVTLLVVGVVVGGASARLRQMDDARMQALEDTIAAETLALRIGDQDAFMLAQAQIERWPDVQALTFAHYQQTDARIIATGEVIDRDIEDDLARVTLRELVDGSPYRVVWFYKYEPQGWRHVPSQPEYWGDMQTTESEYYVVRHVEADRAYAVELGRMLDEQTAAMCDLLVCAPGFYPQTVTVETNALAAAFITTYRSGSREIASPQLERVPEGQTPALDAASVVEIVLDAQSWIQARKGWDAGTQHFDDEIDLWLAHQLVADAPSSPLFDFFDSVYGPTFVPELTRQVSEGIEVRIAAREMLDQALLSEDASLEDTLSALLNFEWMLRDRLYWQQATYLFGDPTRPYRSSILEDEPPVMTASSQALQVTVIQPVGQVMWTEVSYHVEAPVQDGGSELRVALQPFRQVNGQWYRAEAALDDFGELRQMREAQITMLYSELDEPFAERTLEGLVSTYRDLGTDFDMGDPNLLPPIQITLSPVHTEWGSHIGHLEPFTLTHVALPSATILYYQINDEAHSVFDHPAMLTLYTDVLQESLHTSDLGYIEQAIIRYKFYGPTFQRIDSHLGTFGPLEGSLVDLPRYSIEDLFLDADRSPLEEAVLSLTADNLIDQLERIDFGRQDIMPVLVRNLRDVEDGRTWLKAVLSEMEGQGDWPYDTGEYDAVIDDLNVRVQQSTERDLETIIEGTQP